MENRAARGQWGSRLGFVLAAAGSAIGLGNIWKFPYIAGENGGGAFVIVYLACVFLIGMPVMMSEILIGRRGRPARAGRRGDPGAPAQRPAIARFFASGAVAASYSLRYYKTSGREVPAPYRTLIEPTCPTYGHFTVQTPHMCSASTSDFSGIPSRWTLSGERSSRVSRMRSRGERT